MQLSHSACQSIGRGGLTHRIDGNGSHGKGSSISGKQLDFVPNGVSITVSMNLHHGCNIATAKILFGEISINDDSLK